MGIAGFVKPFVFADDFPKVSGADLDLSEMSRKLAYSDFPFFPLGAAHEKFLDGASGELTRRPFLLSSHGFSLPTPRFFKLRFCIALHAAALGQRLVRAGPCFTLLLFPFFSQGVSRRLRLLGGVERRMSSVEC